MRRTLAGNALHSAVLCIYSAVATWPSWGPCIGTHFDPLNAGSINIQGVAPANFTFFLDSDDGSLLSIDGNVVVSNPGAGAIQAARHARRPNTARNGWNALRVLTSLDACRVPPFDHHAAWPDIAVLANSSGTAMIPPTVCNMPCIRGSHNNLMPRMPCKTAHVTPSDATGAGQHGFNGGKSGSVLLGPGVHDIKFEYIQVLAALCHMPPCSVTSCAHGIVFLLSHPNLIAAWSNSCAGHATWCTARVTCLSMPAIVMQRPTVQDTCVLQSAARKRRVSCFYRLQATGPAGIILKYSVAASRMYYGAADREVVPPEWLTHLPAGYLPGLAVQVC